MKLYSYAFALCLVSLAAVTSRQHMLKLKNDNRNAILCSHFAYCAGGFLSVSVDHLDGDLSSVTFTLDKGGTSDVTSYLESKKGNCFRGDRSKFLYLSFDSSRSLLLVRNRDVRLQGLMFEAGARNMEGEEGIIGSPTPSRTLMDGLKLAFDLLNLSPGRSDEFATHFSELLQPFLPENQLIEQSTVYVLLRKLAGVRLPPEKLRELVLSDESPKHRTRFSDSVLARTLGTNSTMMNVSLSQIAVDILSTVYLLTTPLGSLRAIPYQSVQGKPKVKFTVRFPNESEEGLYSFYFHHCPLSTSDSTEASTVNITIRIIEKNKDSYLSAGQQVLPLLYFLMCLVYLLASFAWFSYLKLSKNTIYRIHYLMFAVVLVKAISLAFHGINFYVIGKHGVHEEGWAVMYYITHIIRGALLFIAILLIGAGWAFIKHMLTPRERNVFLIVIPLQILANVATVVIEESEAGTARYALWKDIFIFVDLACCGAILFPVVWSIRHLQAASQTDGKAAINLRNLRLFRHFYILVICYVYFTRVVAYLLSVTMPYSFTWVVELFKESITFLFFVAVGYKFRPVNDNPYLLVPNEDDDDEDTVMERIQLEDVWSQSGVADGVFRTNRTHSQQA